MFEEERRRREEEELDEAEKQEAELERLREELRRKEKKIEEKRRLLGRLSKVRRDLCMCEFGVSDGVLFSREFVFALMQISLHSFISSNHNPFSTRVRFVVVSQQS